MTKEMKPLLGSEEAAIVFRKVELEQAAVEAILNLRVPRSELCQVVVPRVEPIMVRDLG